MSSWLWKHSLTDSIWVRFRNETVPSLCRAKAGGQHRQCACCRNAFPPGLLRKPLCARVESCLPHKPSSSHKHSSADFFKTFYSGIIRDSWKCARRHTERSSVPFAQLPTTVTSFSQIYNSNIPIQPDPDSTFKCILIDRNIIWGSLYNYQGC